MANQLTEAQLADRRKKNKKIFKVIGIILVLSLLARLVPSEKETGAAANNNTKQEEAQKKEQAQKQKLRLDSVIEKIKTDKDIKTQAVEYLADSTLKIVLSPVKSEITAAGFDNLYQILDIGNVSEIEVYKKNKKESSFGFRTQAIIDNFKKEFVSSYDGSCRPVVDYIKEGMNDPSSFDHVRTFVTPISNGNFEIKTVFRGKNAFGGTVLNSSYAEVSPSGNIVSFKMEE